MADGFRLLTRTLVVDLGASIPELEFWEAMAQRGIGNWRIASLAGSPSTMIRVAPGLVYDGASIPLLSQYFMGAKELYETAGVVHDALYLWQAPRGAADRVFWIIARSGIGVGPVRGWLGWAALRTFGWLSYRARRIGGEAQKALVEVAEKIKDAAQ